MGFASKWSILKFWESKKIEIEIFDKWLISLDHVTYYYCQGATTYFLFLWYYFQAIKKLEEQIPTLEADMKKLVSTMLGDRYRIVWHKLIDNKYRIIPIKRPGHLCKSF